MHRLTCSRVALWPKTLAPGERGYRLRLGHKLSWEIPCQNRLRMTALETRIMMRLYRELIRSDALVLLLGMLRH
jgi:hypothetical protein